MRARLVLVVSLSAFFIVLTVAFVQAKKRMDLIMTAETMGVTMYENAINPMQESLKSTFRGGPSGIGSILVLILVSWLLLNAMLFFWMHYDRAMRTGHPFPAALFFLIIAFGLLYLPLYMGSRPTGHVTLCMHCGKPKLKENKVCFSCKHEEQEQRMHGLKGLWAA